MNHSGFWGGSHDVQNMVNQWSQINGQNYFITSPVSVMTPADDNSLPVQVHTNKDHLSINLHKKSLTFYTLHHFIKNISEELCLYIQQKQ